MLAKRFARGGIRTCDLSRMSGNALPQSYTGTAPVCAYNDGGVATALGGHCASARAGGEGGARSAEEGLTSNSGRVRSVGKGVRSAFANAHDRRGTKIEILKTQKDAESRDLAHSQKS